MEYYKYNYPFILDLDKRKSNNILSTLVLLLLIIFAIFLTSKIKIYSYKEYYALKVVEGEKEYLVSNVLVEDTNDVLKSDYIEIDNKKYPIQKTYIINNSDNIPINYNTISIESDECLEIEENALVSVKYLYDYETILNKVKKIIF